jgi:protein-tyrosine phosphatase
MLSLFRRRLFILRTLNGEARRWALRRYLERRASRAARLRSASLSERGRLVFVCHGNIMRSAYAAQVARRAFPAYSDRIVSGGTHAASGSAAQDSALRVSREFDMPLDNHISAPLELLALNGDDVVVCMDALNEANVLAEYPILADRVFRVGDIDTAHETLAHEDRELLDPFGRGDEVTRDAFSRLSTLAEVWISRAARPQS